MDAPEEISSYLQVYFDETDEEIEGLMQALLTLEAHPTHMEALNEAFRLTHSIKGSSGMMGFDNVNTLSHQLESLFDLLRQGQRTFTPSTADLVLRCLDFLRDHTEQLRAGQPVDEHPQALLTALQQILDDVSPASSDAIAVTSEDALQPTPESTTVALAISAVQASDPVLPVESDALEADIYQLSITFEADLQLPHLKAHLIASRLAEAGEILHSQPPAHALLHTEEVDTFVATIQTTLVLDDLYALANVDGVEAISISQEDRSPPLVTLAEQPAQESLAPPMLTEAPDAQRPLPPVTSAATQQASPTIRVDIQRLDHLMNLVGELVVSKARLLQVASGMAPAFRKQTTTTRVELWEDARNHYLQFVEALDQLTRISNNLQQSVLETRMVPLGPLFNRFRRVVRDVGRQVGKDVELNIRGEHTELDKRMIDALAEPLMHLIRNAIDHGLEPPDERQRLGKTRHGNLQLEAAHHGNHVFIKIQDDGRGLNLDQIRAKTVAQGLLEPAAAAALSPSQILEYIWHPGFSTAAQVTDLSGRGVGLDVVKTTISGLNGGIDIDTESGRGAMFTIRLPLTLAIIPSLLVRIRESAFSVPLEEVLEIVRLQVDTIVSIQGHSSIHVRGEFLPLLYLEDIFEWPEFEVAPTHPARRCGTYGERIEVMIIESGGQKMGLRVDETIGNAEVVIKSLADNFRHIRGLSGASVLGDGTVCLMLDTGAIIDMAMQTA